MGSSICSPPAPSVIVIGAGIAGVAAARTLRDSGFKVTVLESNSRIGGRIQTDTQTFGIPVDLGASWIHGGCPAGGNPVAAIVDGFRMATYETSEADSLLYDHSVQRGFQLYAPGAARIDRETVRGFDSWLRRALEEEKQADWSSSTVEDTMRDVLRKHGIVEGHIYQRLLNFYICRIEGWFAAEAREISTKSWLTEEFYGGGHLLLEQGYSPLVSALAEGIDIKLNHRVLTVEIQENQKNRSPSVRIQCENGFTTRADAVVVAVPLGILQSNVIRFEPELPAWKREVIQELEVGHQNKIGLLFESIFWPEDAEFIGLASGTPRGSSYFLSMYRASRRAVLLYMPVGELARTIEGLSDEDATEFAMKRLREMIPDAPAPIASIVTRWSSDPNFLGCYSNDPSSNELDLHGRMGLPVSDQLHFAGEACSAEFPSTVHGAYESGVDTARHIIRRFSPESGGEDEEEAGVLVSNLNTSIPMLPCNLAAHLVESPSLQEVNKHIL